MDKLGKYSYRQNCKIRSDPQVFQKILRYFFYFNNKTDLKFKITIPTTAIKIGLWYKYSITKIVDNLSIFQNMSKNN